jgi:HEAT repeat protein
MLGRLEFELADLDDTRMSMVVRLIATLGDAHHRDAVEPLIRLLEGVELPRPIQREIISALGRIGDPRAVDALLAVHFRVPDTPSTQSVGERALRAVAAIGDPALPSTPASTCVDSSRSWQRRRWWHHARRRRWRVD